VVRKRGVPYSFEKKVDVHEPEIRSYNMKQIRCKDTKPELLVRKLLHLKGFRFRLHVTKLPGKPDIVLPKYQTIIFVHGCFWHGHARCKYFKIPETRKEWWSIKIDNNMRNDEKNCRLLSDLGWQVIIIWECELKPQKRDETLKQLVNNLIHLET